jgi:KDO2-lipid IV(A) lauroyltransferase
MNWLAKLGGVLENATARTLYAGLEGLPVERASALGGAVARAVGPLLPVSRMARRNIARAFPEYDRDRVERVLVETWDNIGRVAGEFPHLEELVRDRVELVGGEILDRLREDGKPGLLFSGHIANWEINAATVVARSGLPLHLVYRAANNPKVDVLFHKGRGGFSSSLIPKGPAGARQMVAVLKGGGHIALLVDQKMNDGIPVPFFGRDAMTAPAVAHLALKFRCPVVPVRAQRLGGTRLRVTVHPPMTLPDSGDRHADARDLMVRINVLLEDWVRDAPGQWLWLHRRWMEN